MAEVMINPDNQKVAVMSTEKVEFFRPVFIIEIAGVSGKFESLEVSEVYASQPVFFPSGIATGGLKMGSCRIAAEGDALCIEAKVSQIGQLSMDNGNNTIPNLEVQDSLCAREIESQKLIADTIQVREAKVTDLTAGMVDTTLVRTDGVLLLQDGEEGTISLKTLNDRIPASIGSEKGQIVVFFAGNTPVVVPVGKPGQVLVADPSADCGVAWKNLSEVK